MISTKRMERSPGKRGIDAGVIAKKKNGKWVSWIYLLL